VTPVAGDPTAYVLDARQAAGWRQPDHRRGADDGENGDHITVAIPNSGPGGSTVSIRMNVLQGDTDHTGEVGGEHSVLAADFSAVKKKFFKDTTSPTTARTRTTPCSTTSTAAGRSWPTTSPR
jgi:hypothetical protein